MVIYTLTENKFENVTFFELICAGDIPVDGFFNTNFTFSKFFGGRISEPTSKVNILGH